MIRFILLLLVAPLSLLAQDVDTAYVKYKEGESAQTPEARKKAFNEALSLYLQAEPENPSAKLCFDIANTEYQLNEYGFAILYYYKALKEEPRNEAVLTNLQLALQKAGNANQAPNFVDAYLLYFHYKISHNEKALFVLIMMFLAFIIWSVHIWQPQAFLPKVASICLWLGLLMALSLVWADFFSNPEAIVVKPTALKRDAGEEYASINAPPALAGTKVTVLSVKPDGNWMRVRLPSGEVGYISKEYARLI